MRGQAVGPQIRTCQARVTRLDPVVKTIVTGVFLGQREGESSALQPELEPRSQLPRRRLGGIFLEVPATLRSLVPRPHWERNEAGGPQVIRLQQGFGHIQRKSLLTREGRQRGWCSTARRSRTGLGSDSQAPPCHAAGDPPFETGRELFADVRCVYMEASQGEGASLPVPSRLGNKGKGRGLIPLCAVLGAT